MIDSFIFFVSGYDPISIEDEKLLEHIRAILRKEEFKYMYANLDNAKLILYLKKNNGGQ